MNALLGVAFSLWVAYQVRRESLMPRRRRLVWAVILLRLVLVLMYYRHNKRFYDDVRRLGAP